MSVYRRKNKSSSTWMIQFHYIDPVTGTRTSYRRSAGKEVKTKDDAMALELLLREQKRRPPPRPEEVRKEARFCDFAGHWKDTRRVGWKPSTYRGYEQILRVHLVPFFGQQMMRSIGPEDVHRFKNESLTRRKPLTPKTVNNCLGVLSTLFKDAVAWRYADRNPLQGVGPVRIDTSAEEFDFWTKEESDAFLEVVRQDRPRWYPFFVCALHTGMRMGEMAALRWKDVDLDRGLIHVRRSFSHGQETSPKSGRPRRMRMTGTLLVALKEHRLATGTSSDRVFLSKDGRMLDSNLVKRTFWACTHKAGLKRIRIHDLRHSCASQLVMAGVPLYKVQTLLGHQHANTTMRYAHLSDESLDEAIQVLDRPTRGTAVHSRYAGGVRG